MADAVVVEIEQGVGTIRMNRPDSLNALSDVLAKDLHAAAKQLADDEQVRCIILTGAGSHFMAGGDITYFNEQLEAQARGDAEDMNALFVHAHGVIRELRRAPKPVLAVVRGACAGYGLSLVAACDLAIAAESTVLTLAYRHLGVSPDGGSTYFLPRIVGLKCAMELAMLGERFTARDAQNMGLVNQVIADDQLDTAAKRVAANLVTGPREALARTKRLINNSLASNLEAQLDAEQDNFVACTQGAEFKEGVSAFLGKRKPSF